MAEQVADSAEIPPEMVVHTLHTLSVAGIWVEKRVKMLAGESPRDELLDTFVRSLPAGQHALVDQR